MSSLVLSMLLITPVFAAATNLEQFGLDGEMIQRYVGSQGHFDLEKQTFKITIPRKDLNVIVNGVKMNLAMGLTSWVAFKKSDQYTMVMGDLVLTENQVNQVMSAVLDNHLEVTALHNHFLWESPKILFMHIEGKGTAKSVSSAIGNVLASIQSTSNGNGEFPLAIIDASVTTLNPRKINSILGINGHLRDGVYKVNMKRTPKLDPGAAVAINKENNMITANTSAIFAGSDEESVVDGDFAMQDCDVQKVQAALRHAGILVVALHQRKIVNSPSKIVFMHYWGVGKTTSLARGLRKALDSTTEVKG